MEHEGTSKPVIHMAQTNTMRSGSSGFLNLLSRSSFTIRLRCVAMSRPFFFNSSISFCDGETTTAMSRPLEEPEPFFEFRLIHRIGGKHFFRSLAIAVFQCF